MFMFHFSMTIDIKVHSNHFPVTAVNLGDLKSSSLCYIHQAEGPQLINLELLNELINN